MLIHHELKIPLKITQGSTHRYAILILRFKDWHFSVTAINLEQDLSIEQESQVDFKLDQLLSFEECLSSFIDYLESSSIEIQIEHSVIAESHGIQSIFTALTETITKGEKYEESLRYKLEVKDLTNQISSGDDPIEVLYKLKSSGIEVRCCGTCENAILPLYGGADPRLGLFCCRDNLNAGLAHRHNGTLEQYEDCLSRVSCFHLCEQYRHRAEPI